MPSCLSVISMVTSKGAAASGQTGGRTGRRLRIGPVTRKTGVPADVAARAFSSRSGELAWVREDAIACSEALGAAGQSVLGGEVWLVDEHGGIQGLLPAKDGGPPGVHHWEVPPWEPSSESWVQFCRRAAAYTVSVLRQMDVEGELASEWWPQVRYNLTWTSQDQYVALGSE
jgi:hypothetical protein